MIRIGLIGTGHLGTIHAGLWVQQQGAQLTALYDHDSERAQKTVMGLPSAHTAICSSVDELFQRSDAVVIVTPTSTHFELAGRAIRAGKHCFIEKPVTTTFTEALTLQDLARQHAVVVHVGHIERFNPVVQSLRNMTGRYVVSPLFIEAHRLAPFKPRATDVSVILDLMIHDIDLCLWLTQSSAIHIDANAVAILTDTPDIANARIRFANGCVANLTASRITQKPMRKMRVFQRDAYISMDFAEKKVDVFRLVAEEKATMEIKPEMMALVLGNIEAGTTKRSIIMEKPTIPDGNAMMLEQEYFIRAIQIGSATATPPATTLPEAAEALRIAEEITRQMMK